MAGQGIDMLLLQGAGRSVQKFYRTDRENLYRDGWAECLSADKIENGSMSNLWQKLSMGLITPTEAVVSLARSENIQVKRIFAFRANRRLVKLKDVYPQEGGEYLCFFKTEGFKWSLLQVGAKNLHEMMAVGSDSSNRSELPMIAYSKVSDETGEKEFVLPNF